MSNQEEQREVQVTIEQAEKAVSIYHALARLKSNKDFQLIIETMYLKEQALDQVSLLSRQEMKEDRERIFEDLVSKSNLSMFLLIIEKQGIRFEDELNDYHTMQEELRGDENEEVTA